VERFVAEREVGDNVALDHSLEKRPLEPRGVAQMAARDKGPRVEAHMREHVAAKGLDKRETFGRFARSSEPGPKRSARQARQDRLDQPKAFADLVDPDPDSGVDVAVAPGRDLEVE